MAKPLSFKDFLVVDYTPGMGEYISYQAQKRHRGVVGESTEVDEALTNAQRIKKRQQMKKMKGRIKLGRLRAMRRTASMDVIKRRSRKKARLLILKRLTRGRSKGELSFAQRQSIEKKLDKMGPRLDRIARRLIPDVRKADRDRKKRMHSQKTDKSTSSSSPFGK